MVVAVERARVRVVRDIDVDPAVAVEVERRDAEAVRAFRARDAGLLGDIVELAVAVVVIQEVPAARAVPAGRTRPRAPCSGTGPSGQRRRRQIEIDVVGDEADRDGRRGRSRGMRSPCSTARVAAMRPAGRGDVVEASVALVSIEPVLAPVGDEQIVVAVVVVVAGAAPWPQPLAQPGARRDVLERAVAAIAIEVVRRLLALRKSLQRGAVHEKDVDPAVAVVVEGGGAGARGLDQVLVLCPARRTPSGPSGRPWRATFVNEKPSRRALRAERPRWRARHQAARATTSDTHVRRDHCVLRCSHDRVGQRRRSSDRSRRRPARDCSSGSPAASATFTQGRTRFVVQSTPSGASIAAMLLIASISSTSSKYGRMLVAIDEIERSAVQPVGDDVERCRGSTARRRLLPTRTVFARCPAGALRQASRDGSDRATQRWSK